MQLSDFTEMKMTLEESCAYYVIIMLLWYSEPKIDWNRLLPTINSKNLAVIMIVSNSRISDMKVQYPL